MIAVIASVCALVLAPQGAFGTVMAAGPLIVLFTAGAAFVWQNRKLTPFAVEPASVREADLTHAPEKLPWFAWLGAGPLLIIALAADFLQANWERIPVRFPVHWGADGQPNRWSDRSIHGVYGPLLFAFELCIWLAIMALATWFGARRPNFRRLIFGIMLGAEYLVGLLFATVCTNPVLRLPIWIPIVGFMLFMVLMVIVTARKISADREPVEPTPMTVGERGSSITIRPTPHYLWRSAPAWAIC